MLYVCSVLRWKNTESIAIIHTQNSVNDISNSRSVWVYWRIVCRTGKHSMPMWCDIFNIITMKSVNCVYVGLKCVHECFVWLKLGVEMRQPVRFWNGLGFVAVSNMNFAFVRTKNIVFERFCLCSLALNLVLKINCALKTKLIDNIRMICFGFVA